MSILSIPPYRNPSETHGKQVSFEILLFRDPLKKLQGKEVVSETKDGEMNGASTPRMLTLGLIHPSYY